MTASLLDLVDRAAPRLPAHATVGEALATSSVEPDDHVAVLDGELCLGLVRGQELIDHARGRVGSRDRTHVCELLGDPCLVADLADDPSDVLARLLRDGTAVAMVQDGGRFVGVVAADDLRPRLAAS